MNVDTTSTAKRGPNKRPNPEPRVLRVLCVSILAGLLTGCGFTPWRATPFRAPADVANIRLERKDSARIIMDKIWLERKEDGLFVTGYVMRNLNADDTMGSQLIVSLRDSSGIELRSIPIDFHPRQIPQQRKPTGTSKYRCALDTLPPNTATIVVSANDNRPST